jgi:hypothetical protein
MQCKELEAVLESEGLSPLPSEAREHLAGCSNCQDLLADLSAIVVAAKGVPAEVAPPDRIWVAIRAQLEAEGIIRNAEPVVAAPAAPWWQSFSEFFRPRVLATVGAGLFVVLGSIYVIEHRHPGNVAQNLQQVPVQTQTASQISPTVAPSSVDQKQTPPTNDLAQQTPPAHPAANHGPRLSTTVLKSSPTEDAYLGESASVLDNDENSLPSRGVSDNAAVDAALRQNLRTLNDFIAECKTRLKQNPQDQLTREYLNMAYQQKAELLTAMLDSRRSEH